MPLSLTVGDADSVLEERLGQELDTFDLGAVGRDDLREFTVKVDDDGELVAERSCRQVQGEADLHLRNVL